MEAEPRLDLLETAALTEAPQEDAEVDVRQRWRPGGKQPAQMRQIERRSVERHDRAPVRRPRGELIQVATPHETARSLLVENADDRHVVRRLDVQESGLV